MKVVWRMCGIEDLSGLVKEVGGCVVKGEEQK